MIHFNNIRKSIENTTSYKSKEISNHIHFNSISPIKLKSSERQLEANATSEKREYKHAGFLKSIS